MASQTTLIILLVGLSLALAILLFRRIRSERQIMAVINRIEPDSFAEFVRVNATDGSIQLIARKVSDFLKTSFGCERIIFMRKQRAHLELNYYHGIRGFRREEFRFRYSGNLAATLREDPLPRTIDSLSRFISDDVRERLEHHKLDQFFPIFWRENLYGIYFIRSSLATRTAPFRLLIGSLAHALGAAYHIKWHEARYERMEQHNEKLTKVKPRTENTPRLDTGILKLVRNRQSEALIPQIGQMLKNELGLGDLALIYEAPERTDPIQIWRSNRKDELPPFDNESFANLLKELPDSAPLTISSEHKGEKGADFLNGSGFKFVARFPVTGKRKGVIAWNSSDNPASTFNQLEPLSRLTRDLVENAEAYERIEAMSNTDNLTGLANQRYFHKRLHEEVNRATRYDRHLSLIIFDLDDLKGINDNYGHLAGDAVLKRMGQILRGSIRAIDVVARYGGDEFCVIMPEADEQMCRRFMERLRQKISSSKFTTDQEEQSIQCTISQGGAVFPDCAKDAKSLVHAADSALLEAKEMGRDRFVMNCEAKESASS